MDINEKILTLVKEKGPVVPVQIAKDINQNILMTSARLSELLSNKQVMISYIKIGSSPLYYVTGQEIKLQEYANNLADREKEAYDLIRNNKILRDFTQEPSIRVALRQIKDFAIPLQVKYENKNEIFWRWYLSDNKEAESLIKEILSKNEEIKKTESTDEQKEKTKIPEKRRVTQKEKKSDKDTFLNEIINFFNKNKINVLTTNELKKNSEIDFIIELQTTIGNVKYFCKSKNKKKTTESDLSTALVQAQPKGLPLLFITTGKITKKANQMLGKEFKNIKYKEI